MLKRSIKMIIGDRTDLINPIADLETKTKGKGSRKTDLDVSKKTRGVFPKRGLTTRGRPEKDEDCEKEIGTENREKKVMDPFPFPFPRMGIPKRGSTTGATRPSTTRLVGDNRLRNPNKLIIRLNINR